MRGFPEARVGGAAVLAKGHEVHGVLSAAPQQGSKEIVLLLLGFELLVVKNSDHSIDPPEAGAGSRAPVLEYACSSPFCFLRQCPRPSTFDFVRLPAELSPCRTSRVCQTTWRGIGRSRTAADHRVVRFGAGQIHATLSNSERWGHRLAARFRRQAVHPLHPS